MEENDDKKLMLKWLRQLRPVVEEMSENWRIFKDYDFQIDFRLQEVYSNLNSVIGAEDTLDIVTEENSNKQDENEIRFADLETKIQQIFAHLGIEDNSNYSEYTDEWYHTELIKSVKKNPEFFNHNNPEIKKIIEDLKAQGEL